MDHNDHVNLLRKGVPEPGGVWADLGSGRGAFTLALAELMGAAGIIYSVDQDGQALKDQETAMHIRYPDVDVHYIKANFANQIDLHGLDGIVMANSLHFTKRKEPVMAHIHDYLRPGGRLLLVEYNVDKGNLWVPYPLSYGTWKTLADKSGFQDTQLLATRSSRFLSEIFSAISIRS